MSSAASERTRRTLTPAFLPFMLQARQVLGHTDSLPADLTWRTATRRAPQEALLGSYVQAAGAQARPCRPGRVQRMPSQAHAQPCKQRQLSVLHNFLIPPCTVLALKYRKLQRELVCMRMRAAYPQACTQGYGLCSIYVLRPQDHAWCCA